MSGDADAYQCALRDIVYDLVERARKNEESDAGYRSAMLHVLGLIKSQATTFGLDLQYLGLAEFDPEAWFVGTCGDSK
jgi:hypothetical protein